MMKQFIELGLIFGIVSMFGWGVGDLLSAVSSKRIGFVSAALFGNVFIILTTIFVLSLRGISFSFMSTAVALSVGAGIMHGVADLAFYKGLEIGSVSLVSPIASIYPLILIPAASIFFGETLTPTQAFAVLIVVAGGLSASIDTKNLVQKRAGLFSDKGIPYALLTAIGWGLGFILLDYAVEDLDWIIPTLIMQISIAAVYVVFTILTKARLKLPRDNDTWMIVALSGIASAIAYASYSIGIERYFTSLIAPIAAAFPVVTIVLAHIFLKERLTSMQKLGISTLIFGVVLLAG